MTRGRSYLGPASSQLFRLWLFSTLALITHLRCLSLILFFPGLCMLFIFICTSFCVPFSTLVVKCSKRISRITLHWGSAEAFADSVSECIETPSFKPDSFSDSILPMTSYIKGCKRTCRTYPCILMARGNPDVHWVAYVNFLLPPYPCDHLLTFLCATICINSHSTDPLG